MEVVVDKWKVKRMSYCRVNVDDDTVVKAYINGKGYDSTDTMIMISMMIMMMTTTIEG